jgi:hypothetical protein
MINVLRVIQEDYVNNVIYFKQMIQVMIVILNLHHLNVGNVKILNIIF